MKEADGGALRRRSVVRHGGHGLRLAGRRGRGLGSRLDPVEPLPGAETVDPGEGFTEDGNLVTRDLLYDKATNKQFITVQTSGGNTFYIVIDYDKPTDEDGEQYQTYFLSMVDEADLLAAMQAAGGGAGGVFLRRKMRRGCCQHGLHRLRREHERSARARLPSLSP